MVANLFLCKKNPIKILNEYWKSSLFSSFGVFPATEIEQIISQFEPKIYQKSAVVLDFGETNDKLYFIESGILREFSMQEDQD